MCRGKMCFYAAHNRKETGMITNAVGRINDPQQADDILAEGKADMVVMGRAQIATPNLSKSPTPAMLMTSFAASPATRAATTAMCCPNTRTFVKTRIFQINNTNYVSFIQQLTLDLAPPVGGRRRLHHDLLL